jgi:hypothetical protein
VWRVPYSALGGGKLPAFRWVLPAFAALLTLYLSLGFQLVRTRGSNSGTLASALGKNREPSRASMERRFKRGTIAPPPPPRAGGPQHGAGAAHADPFV